MIESVFQNQKKKMKKKKPKELKTTADNNISKSFWGNKLFIWYGLTSTWPVAPPYGKEFMVHIFRALKDGMTSLSTHDFLLTSHYDTS